MLPTNIFYLQIHIGIVKTFGKHNMISGLGITQPTKILQIEY